MRTSELRTKDVVDVRDGRRLGTISDLELDMERGEVTALILPGVARIMGFFGREQETTIPWSRIVRIGVDVILVEREGADEDGK